MATLALLQLDPRARAHLTEALRDDYDLRTYGTWARLWNAALTSPMAGCIIDVYSSPDPIPPSRLGLLRQKRPDLAIVVYSDFAGRETDLFELGRKQVNAVIMAGVEDSAPNIRRTVERSLASAAGGVVSAALEGLLPSLGVEGLRWSVEHALDHPGVEDLAGSLSMSHGRLARELRRLELPPPRRLLLWGRLLQGARLLKANDSTVEEVAHRLGYSSNSAFRRAVHRHVGCPPTAMSRRGGMSCVLEAFISSTGLRKPRGKLPRVLST